MAGKAFTIKEVAADLGCSHATVWRRAVAMQLGVKVGERMLLLKPSEVAKLRRVIKPRPKRK